MQLIQDHAQRFAQSEPVETPLSPAREGVWPERRAIKMWDGEVSTLAWEKADPRAPSLLFAHANGFDALTYRSLLEGLADELRLYATDLRGHGNSTLAANPKGMSSWLIYRDDVVRLLQELDVQSMLSGRRLAMRRQAGPVFAIYASGLGVAA